MATPGRLLPKVKILPPLGNVFRRQDQPGEPRKIYKSPDSLVNGFDKSSDFALHHITVLDARLSVYKCFSYMLLSNDNDTTLVIFCISNFSTKF